MEENCESEIFVVKHIYSYKRCQECNGNGIRTRVFRKRTYVEDCPVCNGTGRERFVIKKEIPLSVALKEING